MKVYPTVITSEILTRFAHIPDDEIRNDLVVTRQEIATETERAQALRDVAATTTHALERRLMDYRAFLEALLSARGVAV